MNMPGSSLELSHACGWKFEVGIAMKMVLDRQVRGVYFVCVYLRVLCFRPFTHAHISERCIQLPFPVALHLVGRRQSNGRTVSCRSCQFDALLTCAWEP